MDWDFQGLGVDNDFAVKIVTDCGLHLIWRSGNLAGGQADSAACWVSRCMRSSNPGSICRWKGWIRKRASDSGYG